MLLSEMIEIVSNKNQNNSIEILLNIDSISCLFQDNITLLMNMMSNVLFVKFKLQLYHRLSMVNLVLFLLVIYQLSINSTVNDCVQMAIIFTFTNHSQLHLRMTSIQYIHTQSFLSILLIF